MLGVLHDLAADERAAEDLARGESVVLDAWLGPGRALALRLEVIALLATRLFHAAGVGAGAARALAPAVRRDSVCWFATDGSVALPVPRHEVLQTAAPPAVVDRLAVTRAAAAPLTRLATIAGHLNEARRTSPRSRPTCASPSHPG